MKKEQPIVLESNQNNATITNNGICPTLSASMGMGGGYVPMICYRKSRRAMSGTDFETWVDDNVANTINTFENSSVRAMNIVVVRNESNIDREEVL